MQARERKEPIRKKSISRDTSGCKRPDASIIAKRTRLILQIFAVGLEIFEVKMPIRISSELKDGEKLDSEIWVLPDGMIRFVTIFIKGKDFEEDLAVSFYIEKINIQTPYSLFRLNDDVLLIKFDLVLIDSEESKMSLKKIYNDFMDFSMTLREDLKVTSEIMTDSNLFKFYSGEAFH